MSTIEVAVAGRGIQVKQGYEKPSAGDVNTCEVSLAIESGGVWDSLPHKRVTFSTRTASVTVDYAPTITIPHEVMASPGALYLTLTGYDADGIEVARTHRMTYPIEVAKAGADEGAEPSPATLDVVSRIDALAADLEQKRDTDYWRGEPGAPGAPGVPGEPGADGYSPTANVTKDGSIATITVTDKNGTTTATVSDGAPGSDANVTKENVEAALGYEPLNAAYANKIYIMQKQIENLQGIAATEETDTTEAYTKTVPTGAQKWASLDKVGGKTVVNSGELVSAEVVEVESKGTFPIPQSVREMCPGYGWSAGTACNEIDFGRKVYVQRVYKYTFTGNEPGFFYPGGSAINQYSLKLPIAAVASKPGVHIVCNKYVGSYYGDVWYRDKNVSLLQDGTQAYFVDSALNSLDEAREYVRNNEVTVCYELAEPIEVDLSNVLPDDHYIEVEAGGTITFKQASTQLPVPSSVTYQISTKEVVANA